MNGDPGGDTLGVDSSFLEALISDIAEHPFFMIAVCMVILFQALILLELWAMKNRIRFLVHGEDVEMEDLRVTGDDLRSRS